MLIVIAVDNMITVIEIRYCLELNSNRGIVKRILNRHSRNKNKIGKSPPICSNRPTNRYLLLAIYGIMTSDGLYWLLLVNKRS